MADRKRRNGSYSGAVVTRIMEQALPPVADRTPGTHQEGANHG